MATAATAPSASHAVHEKLKQGPGKIGIAVFGVALAAALVYTVTSLTADISGVRTTSVYPFLLLGVALLIALGFEFVNGFHDTANAVATVIYTHSLEPHVAVVYSGILNFIGVMVSSGTVAFSIITLLPVELILQVGSGAGFAMVFALLFAAIIWNLGTWWFGLPSSSSHTMVGSIIGVGLANQLMAPKTGTSGVDWAQVTKVFQTLLVSPVIGFGVAAILLLIAKMAIRDKRLYQAPEGAAPPPFWIRMLLIGTCGGVSYGHGSNDGQKGMGLIMLILVGTVPTAYALNHAITPKQTQNYLAVSHQTVDVLNQYVQEGTTIGDPRVEVTDYIRTRQFNNRTMLALRTLVNDMAAEMGIYKSLKAVPETRIRNFRNDMYIVAESLRLLKKAHTPSFTASDTAVLENYQTYVDGATRFIPTWVKVAVAMALGLGTMIGWKRIVVTVGEKIGKDHLTYAQGAAAEVTCMATILWADRLGLPVSTTHILSSGVAGTMAANKSGLQWATVKNLLMAWVLTLPASVLISGSLFWLFEQIPA